MKIQLRFFASLRERVGCGATEIEVADEKMRDLTLQLIYLGVFTLIFGILIPFLLFRRLIQEVAQAKHKVEEKLSHWIAHWFQTHKAHGEKSFQDPVFWLQILLLTVEVFAPQSKNPIAGFLLEFAPILRKELGSEKKSHDHAVKKTA